jgi:hypothetical protein
MDEKGDESAHCGILAGTSKIRNPFAGSTNQAFAGDRLMDGRLVMKTSENEAEPVEKGDVLSR